MNNQYNSLQITQDLKEEEKLSEEAPKESVRVIPTASLDYNSPAPECKCIQRNTLRPLSATTRQVKERFKVYSSELSSQNSIRDLKRKKEDQEIPSHERKTSKTKQILEQYQKILDGKFQEVKLNDKLDLSIVKDTTETILEHFKERAGSFLIMNQDQLQHKTLQILGRKVEPSPTNYNFYQNFQITYQPKSLTNKSFLERQSITPKRKEAEEENSLNVSGTQYKISQIVPKARESIKPKQVVVKRERTRTQRPKALCRPERSKILTQTFWLWEKAPTLASDTRCAQSPPSISEELKSRFPQAWPTRSRRISSRKPSRSDSRESREPSSRPGIQQNHSSKK